MVITARQQPTPAGTAFAEPIINGPAGAVGAKAVRSGELRTRFNNFRYGRYEARFKPPTSSGNFIATLFTLRTPKFQEWREIDIEVTADRPQGVLTNVIFANNVFSWNASIEDRVERFPAGESTRGLPAGFANQEAFHTYAFEWLPDRVTWFVDDVSVRHRDDRYPCATPPDCLPAEDLDKSKNNPDDGLPP
jgi:beta-glucanase (GH16 family)